MVPLGKFLRMKLASSVSGDERHLSSSESVRRGIVVLVPGVLSNMQLQLRRFVLPPKEMRRTQRTLTLALLALEGTKR
jgi:hypothetical protein